MLEMLKLPAMRAALLSFVIGLGVGCGQPLSMTYGAHVVIPTMFGAIGTVTGLATVFWLCATALMGGSVMNARYANKNHNFLFLLSIFSANCKAQSHCAERRQHAAQ